MKYILIIIPLLTTSILAFSNPLPSQSEEIAAEKMYHENYFAIDLQLADQEDADLNKVALNELVTYLNRNNIQARIQKDILKPTVRVEIDPKAHEKFFWVIENTKDFNVTHIYTYNITPDTISQNEVIPEISGAVPFDSVSILVDKRRLHDLMERLDKKFDSVKFTNDSRIAAYGVSKNPDYEEVVFEVRNSKRVLIELLTLLSDFKVPNEVRDYEAPYSLIDLDKFRKLKKSGAEFIAEDLIADPVVPTLPQEINAAACAALFVL